VPAIRISVSRLTGDGKGNLTRGQKPIVAGRITTTAIRFWKSLRSWANDEVVPTPAVALRPLQPVLLIKSIPV